MPGGSSRGDRGPSSCWAGGAASSSARGLLQQTPRTPGWLPVVATPWAPGQARPGQPALPRARPADRGAHSLQHPSPPRAVASLTVSAKAQPCWGVPSSLRVGTSHAGLLCAHTRGATWKVLEGACVCHRRSPGAPSPSRASPWRPALQQHPSARLLGLEPSRGQRGVCPLSGT